MLPLLCGGYVTVFSGRIALPPGSTPKIANCSGHHQAIVRGNNRFRWWMPCRVSAEIDTFLHGTRSVPWELPDASDRELSSDGPEVGWPKNFHRCEPDRSRMPQTACIGKRLRPLNSPADAAPQCRRYGCWVRRRPLPARPASVVDGHIAPPPRSGWHPSTSMSREQEPDGGNRTCQARTSCRPRRRCCS